MLRRALLLINRHSRQGDGAYDQIVAELHSHGMELSEGRGEHESLSDAIQRQRDNIDLVIVGGGDGTLNQAIAGLIATGLPLGIIPLGTANDLARTLQLPVDPVAACAVIAGNHQRRIDVGAANGHYFFNVASLGLSVEIARQLDPQLKRRLGVLAYLWTAVCVLFRARRFQAVIRAADQTYQVRTLQIAVGNGVHYGGGMTVSDRAAIDDGKLDLYSLEVRHWWQIFWLLPHILRGTHGSSRWVRMLHGDRFQVETSRRRGVNTDGEITAHTPVTFQVFPRAVTVLVPPTPQEDAQKNTAAAPGTNPVAPRPQAG